MPFDDAGFVDTVVRAPPDDPLEKLGLTPVPKDFVEAYKKEYRKRFMATKPRGPGPFKWRYADLPYRPVCWLLTQGVKYYTSDDYSSAPAALIALAERVERVVPDVQFELEYFYTDPILNVWYSHHGPRRACLGIWDQGKLIAIAEPKHAPLLPASRFDRAWEMISRLFNFH